MQIYADITGRPMKISRSDQTPALGAAIFAAVAAGIYDNVGQAQRTMTGTKQEYNPDPGNHKIYSLLYALYRQLHDGFGIKNGKQNMYNVMKDLLDIRDQVRKEK